MLRVGQPAVSPRWSWLNQMGDPQAYTAAKSILPANELRGDDINTFELGTGALYLPLSALRPITKSVAPMQTANSAIDEGPACTTAA